MRGKIKFRIIINKELFNQTKDNIELNQFHFIVLCYHGFIENARDQKSIKGIKKALKKFGCTSAILTTIRMYKRHCITKEEFEEMYQTKEESETRRDLSVGEDLETFIERIKNGEINKGTIPERGDRKNSFLLCLLDKKERKKLEQKDKDFMETFRWSREADVPEAEWKASESNLKFSNSVCIRVTHFIDASSIIQ